MSSAHACSSVYAKNKQTIFRCKTSLLGVTYFTLFRRSTLARSLVRSLSVSARKLECKLFHVFARALFCYWRALSTSSPHFFFLLAARDSNSFSFFLSYSSYFMFRWCAQRLLIFILIKLNFPHADTSVFQSMLFGCAQLR